MQKRSHANRENNSSFLPFLFLISTAGRLSSVSLQAPQRPADRTGERAITLQRQSWWRGWEEQMDKESRRGSALRWAAQFSSKDPAQGYRELWSSPSKRPLTLAGLLGGKEMRTGAELRGLCVHQVTMAGSGNWQNRRRLHFSKTSRQVRHHHTKFPKLFSSWEVVQGWGTSLQECSF